MEEKNIGDIKEQNSGTYDYKTTLTIDSGNPLIEKVFSLVGKLGLNMSVDGLSQKGLTLEFDYTAGQPLNDFRFELSCEVPLSIAKVELSIVYEQNKHKKYILNKYQYI